MKEQPNTFPKTLQQAIVYFANPDNALAFMVTLRWPDGKITCPRCESDKYTFISTRWTWQCKSCKKMFTVKLGTLMEDSPIGLDKWLAAIWMIGGAKNGISSYEIHRGLGITQKSAWFLMHRIRLAMQTGTFEKLGGNGGQVEADETYIGGKARNMHFAKREAKIGTGTGSIDKVAVMGLLERHGEIRVKVIPNIHKATLHTEVKENVEPGAELFTDALKSYLGLDEYIHQFIDHAEKYVDGQIHTNGLENFWCLLKRCLKGTYISVEPFHLFRYLNEQSFRFNNRKVTDQIRFLAISRLIIGRRLTYKQLTGKAV